MVIEELLKFFVGEVNAQLFESIKSKNFETSNIETTNKEGSWEFGGKSDVTVLGDEVKQSFEDGLSQGTSGVSDLIWGLTFGNVLRTDLYSWGTQVFQHISRIETEEVGAFIGGFSSIWFGLFLSLLLFKRGTLEVHNTGGDFPDSVDYIGGEFQNFERFQSGFQFITIIETVDGDFTTRTIWVLVWIGDQQTLFNNGWDSVGDNLVEDVVGSFTTELVNYS
jgi:hypothetical protein